jgi:hypothetical protein
MCFDSSSYSGHNQSQPSVGWRHSERDSLQDRGEVDLVMALALIHHLVISNNIPLSHIASYFSKFGEYLLIEFVPKEDSQVQHLLAHRKDIFTSYNLDGFKKSFSIYYEFLEDTMIKETHRHLFLLRRNNQAETGVSK